EGQNIDFKICCTVSIFNIYYFPEFFDWFGKNFPGLRIFWNLLFDPWRLNVQILPKPVKAIITERLRKHVTSTYTMSEEETKTIEELVTFLNESVDKPFEEFFRYVNRHDTFRQESFPAVFPEFYELIKGNEPDEVDWTLSQIAQVTDRAIKNAHSNEELAQLLSKSLNAGKPLTQSQSLALNLLRYHRTVLQANLSYVPVVFSALSGLPLQDVDQNLNEAVFSRIRTITRLDSNDLDTKNVALLRACVPYSNELLYALACEHQKSLLDSINKLTLIELVSRLDNEYEIFTEQAQELISGKVDWNMPNVFKDVCKACFSNSENETKLGLAKKWAESFKYDSHHTANLLYAVFGFYSNEADSNSNNLIHLLTSALAQTKQAKVDPLFAQKMSVLNVCALHSESLMCSLVLTEKETLAQDISTLSLIELINHVEVKHGLFGAFATRLIADEISWENCTIFEECATIIFPSKEDVRRWNLCEQWSHLFRDSKHLITLYKVVLNLPSARSIAKTLVDSLRSMKHANSNVALVAENIRLLELVLETDAVELALADFLQTGQSQLFDSLLKQTPAQVRGLIENKYGVSTP
ncbi:MAG: hypothetical protein K9G41_09850, partial [Flavobacteriales bacterium]|nr:hypothetical protein [Flavobacteriales bacterium]